MTAAGTNETPNHFKSSVLSRASYKLKEYWSTYTLVIVVVIYILMKAVMNVLKTRVISNVGSTYTTVLISFIWLPLGLVFRIPIVLSYIVWHRWKRGDKRYDWRFLWWNSPVNENAPGVVWFALYTLQSCLLTIFSSVPAPFLKTIFNYAISQVSMLCVTMVVAMVFLRTRYQYTHYIGVATCLLALCAQMIPQLQVQGDPCEAVEHGIVSGDNVNEQANFCFRAYSTPTGSWKLLSAGAMIMWIILAFVSQIPSATMNLQLQHKMQSSKIDILQFSWTSTIYFELPINMLLIVAAWIPWPNQNALPVADTFKVIGWTWDCLNGKDTAKFEGKNFGQTCEGQNTMLYYVLYIFINIFYNLMFPWIVRRTSATWYSVMSMVCFAIQQMLTQFKFLMGDRAQLMEYADWVALLFLLIGFWTYSLQKEGKKKTKTNKEEGVPSKSVSPVELEKLSKFESAPRHSFYSKSSFASALQNYDFEF